MGRLMGCAEFPYTAAEQSEMERRKNEILNKMQIGINKKLCRRMEVDGKHCSATELSADPAVCMSGREKYNMDGKNLTCTYDMKLEGKVKVKVPNEFMVSKAKEFAELSMMVEQDYGMSMNDFQIAVDGSIESMDFFGRMKAVLKKKILSKLSTGADSGLSNYLSVDLCAPSSDPAKQKQIELMQCVNGPESCSGVNSAAVGGKTLCANLAEKQVAAGGLAATGNPNCPLNGKPINTDMQAKLAKAVGAMNNPFAAKNCTMCHDSGERNFSDPVSVKAWIAKKGGIENARTKLQHDLQTGRMPQGGPALGSSEIPQFIKYVEAIDAVK